MTPQPQLVYAEQPVVALSPGKRLQRSREEQGLSQTDVANSLRLPLNVVQALEEDRHEGIHTTYLKGYLRSYARLVGVSTDLVVADVRQTLADRQAEVLKAQLDQKQIDSSHRLIKTVSYALGASLLLLGALWWRGQHSVEVDTAANPTVETPAPAEAVPLVPTLPAAAVSENGAIAEAKESSATPEASAEAPAPDATQPAAANTAEPVTATAAAEPAAPPAPAVDETMPATEERGMVLRFSGDSWTEISDAKGKRLYKKLAKSGETVKIAEGVTPYRVTVGNAPGLAMSFDGKTIDLSGFARNGVARFKIDADGNARK